MRWYIKLWLRRTANNPLTSQFSSLSDAAVQQEIDNGDPSALLDIVESQESRIVLPYLNLAWVVSPSCRAFRSLTVYERFLLYLKYRENLKLREISKRLGRDKMVILAHLNMALTKLRDTWDKEGD
jgi:DNA-directed RNA polymerase specialized sigma24 family protein